MKRLTTLFLGLFLFAVPAQASYTLIANTGAASADNTTVTTTGITTTGADLIVIGISGFATSSPCTPTDSQSNSWTGLTIRSNGTSEWVKIWYKQSPATAGSNSHTFTCTSAGTYPAITVAAFSGSVASPFDQENGGSTASGTSLATGSITPSENNELIISVLCINTSGGATVNESMTETNDIAYGGGTNMGGVMAYKIQTTATAINPTWSFSSTSGAAAVASFKAASSPASSPPTMMLTGVGR